MRDIIVISEYDEHQFLVFKSETEQPQVCTSTWEIIKGEASKAGYILCRKRGFYSFHEFDVKEELSDKQIQEIITKATHDLNNMIANINDYTQLIGRLPELRGKNLDNSLYNLQRAALEVGKKYLPF